MITTNSELGELCIEDIGVTLRTLLAYAATGYLSNPKRVWKVRYKSTVIASVRLKTDWVKKNALSELQE